MSMDKIAGNFGDVFKHFVLTELIQQQLNRMNPNEQFCFYDAFGGNYISEQCRSAAKHFHQNIEKSTFKNKKDDCLNKLKSSTYFQVMDQKMWTKPKRSNTPYFGSTKWVEEVFLMHNNNNYTFKILHNTYKKNIKDYKENTRNQSHIPKQIDFPSHDAYKDYEEYIKEIGCSNKGMLFIDPYWNGKSKSKDRDECKKLIAFMMKHLDNHKGWSMLIWMPLYNKEYLRSACLLETEIRKYTTQYLKCKIFKAQYPIFDLLNANNQCLRGVRLFWIADHSLLQTVNLSTIGVKDVGKYSRPKNTKAKNYNFSEQCIVPRCHCRL